VNDRLTMDLPIKRVYIANRGEIALRVIHACRRLGLNTVIGVSEADRESMVATVADKSVCIGPASSSNSYLNIDAHLAAALATGCDSVHPGYGFLSEKGSFSKACADKGLCFIAPSAEIIEALGDKIRAREIADKCGVPTVPGSRSLKSPQDVLEFAERHGYPILLKASAGGGGRGMRVVREKSELESKLASATAEAKAAFGDDTVFVERYIECARHIEVQVLGDHHGHILHLGERDCSTQRRHQKLIEEAPSPVITETIRAQMTEAAVRLCRAVSYVGAGTVEFIFDQSSSKFYFLEVNTRIQVEHPVTEMVTGVDILTEQIRCAAGLPMQFSQADLCMSTGHAIECRINAESARNDFQPSPGRITEWLAPFGPGVRLDSHCHAGYLVPPYYDSLLGKLIIHGADREDALSKLRSCLAGFRIRGIDTTVELHRSIVSDPDFITNRVTTTWVEHDFLPRWN